MASSFLLALSPPSSSLPKETPVPGSYVLPRTEQSQKDRHPDVYTQHPATQTDGLKSNTPACPLLSRRLHLIGLESRPDKAPCETKQHPTSFSLERNFHFDLLAGFLQPPYF